jgi:hypothetical protein
VYSYLTDWIEEAQWNLEHKIWVGVFSYSQHMEFGRQAETAELTIPLFLNLLLVVLCQGRSSDLYRPRLCLPR